MFNNSNPVDVFLRIARISFTSIDLGTLSPSIFYRGFPNPPAGNKSREDHVNEAVWAVPASGVFHFHKCSFETGGKSSKKQEKDSRVIFGFIYS